MSNKRPEDFDWPSSWDRITDEEEAAGLLEQLLLEVSQGHVLYGRQCRTVARAGYNDDVLYEITDGIDGYRYAMVHLVWSASGSPDYPSTYLYGSLEDWLRSPGG